MRGVVLPPHTGLQKEAVYRTPSLDLLPQEQVLADPSTPGSSQDTSRTRQGSAVPMEKGTGCHPSLSIAPFPLSTHIQKTQIAPSRGSTGPATSNQQPPAPTAPSTSKLLHTEQRTLNHLKPDPTTGAGRGRPCQGSPSCLGKGGDGEDGGEAENESKPFHHRLQSHHQQEPSEQFKYKMNCFNI